MVKLAIIEDDSEIRQTLKRYLCAQDEFECVLVAGSIEEFQKIANDVEAIDVILSDIGLPGITGIQGIPIMKKAFPSCNILMITVFHDSERIFQALCSGASGYLLKSTPLPKVKEAILEVANDHAAMSPSIARKVIEYFRPQTARNNQELTNREKQIVQALVDGLSYKMVADRLSISFETVKQHIKNIYKKLHINSKAELISKSYKGEI